MSPKNKQTVRRILKRVLKLFGPEGEHWTKGAMAQGKNRHGISMSRATKNCKFCLSGAIRFVAKGETEAELARKALEYPLAALGYYSIIGFNDQPWRDFEDVKHVLKSTIERLS
jgi:hypothetical protein